MNNRLTILLMVLLLSLITSPLFAQLSSYFLGTIKDLEGEEHQNAVITMTSFEGFIDSDTTETNGVFTVEVRHESQNAVSPSYTLPLRAKAQVRVYNVLGRLAYSGEVPLRQNGFIILHDTSHLSNGVYFLVMEVGDKTFTQKRVLLQGDTWSGQLGVTLQEESIVQTTKNDRSTSDLDNVDLNVTILPLEGSRPFTPVDTSFSLDFYTLYFDMDFHINLGPCFTEDINDSLITELPFSWQLDEYVENDSNTLWRISSEDESISIDNGRLEWTPQGNSSVIFNIYVSDELDTTLVDSTAGITLTYNLTQ